MTLQLQICTVEEMLGKSQLFKDMLSHRVTLLKPFADVPERNLSLVDLASQIIFLREPTVPDDLLERMPVVVIPKQSGALPSLILAAYMHPIRLEEITIGMYFSEAFNPYDKPQNEHTRAERDEIIHLERTLISHAAMINQRVFQEERVFHMRLGLTIVEERIRLVVLRSCYYGGKDLARAGSGEIPIFDVPMEVLDLHFKWRDED